jgi:AcrR family transcriptional regulator
MPYRTSKETQLRKDEKKEFIIRTAARIFAERGYNGTTVNSIVEETKTSVGTFYFYFPNKEALFETVYGRLNQLFKEIDDFALSRSDNVVKGFCRCKAADLWYFQHFSGLAWALMIEASNLGPDSEQKKGEIINQSNERVISIFNKMYEKGELKDADPKIDALMCNGAMFSVITDWLRQEKKTNLTDYAFQIVTFNLNAFRIAYNDDDVKKYIRELLEEIENEFEVESLI